VRRRRNRDRLNAAGGLGEGERTIRKGGWLKFGDDWFWSGELELFAGWRVYVSNLEDAFSPAWAECRIEKLSDKWIRIYNVYHLACKNQLPKHLEFLRPRMGKLVRT
jgi:hypothetical protein